jgi:hypothetical protein
MNVEDSGQPAVRLPDLVRCRAFVYAHLVGEPPASVAAVLARVHGRLYLAGVPIWVFRAS